MAKTNTPKLDRPDPNDTGFTDNARDPVQEAVPGQPPPQDMAPIDELTPRDQDQAIRTAPESNVAGVIPGATTLAGELSALDVHAPVAPSALVGDDVLFGLAEGVERPAKVIAANDDGSVSLQVFTNGRGDNGYLESHERSDRSLTGQTMGTVWRTAERSVSGALEQGRFRYR